MDIDEQQTKQAVRINGRYPPGKSPLSDAKRCEVRIA
jgi:hypothetical protein